MKLCWLGFHKWDTTRKVSLYDMFPSPFDKNYSTPTRECQDCGKKQKWLPGYGGSEIGCWTP